MTTSSLISQSVSNWLCLRRSCLLLVLLLPLPQACRLKVCTAQLPLSLPPLLLLSPLYIPPPLSPPFIFPVSLLKVMLGIRYLKSKLPELTLNNTKSLPENVMHNLLYFLKTHEAFAKQKPYVVKALQKLQPSNSVALSPLTSHMQYSGDIGACDFKWYETVLLIVTHSIRIEQHLNLLIGTSRPTRKPTSPPYSCGLRSRHILPNLWKILAAVVARLCQC